MIRNKRIFQYVSKFGIFNGTKIFFKVRRAKEKGVINFKVPGLDYPIYLRRDSSDFFVFEEIFIEERYQLKGKYDLAYIIDAGSNIGLSALYFLKSFPKAKIVCIEPETQNFNLLVKNTKSYPNIICYQNGLWNSNCLLRITNQEEGNWAFMVEETTESAHAIPSISIDEILIQHPTLAVDLIKIDIEGSEKEVFERNTAWISKTKNIIVEIHENMRAGAENSVKNALINFTYEVSHDNFFFKLKD